jgi:hypothetical protein
MAGQGLRAQRSEDPLHRVRVGETHSSKSFRRHPAAARTCCGAALIQAVTSSTVVCARTARPPCTAPAPTPGNAGSRAHPQVRHHREAVQQVPVRRRLQARGPGGNLVQGFLSGSGHAHVRLNRQRGFPAGTMTSAIPVLAWTRCPPGSDTGHPCNVTNPGHPGCPAITVRARMGEKAHRRCPAPDSTDGNRNQPAPASPHEPAHDSAQRTPATRNRN